MKNKRIIINATLNEVRVAITEDEKLAEFYIEMPDKERYVGNVYLGKVSKIVQGLNAAFIDIGLKQDAFLHFSDVDESLEHIILKEEDDDDEPDFLLDEDDDDNEDTANIAANKTDVALRKVKPATSDADGKFAIFNTKRSGQVQINLEAKQEVIVQVVREAYAKKGVKVTTRVGLPGRHVVLLPFDNLLGVSRKIQSYQERRRLRSLARKVLPKGVGCIIRTAAAGKSEDELKRDWDGLLEIWKDMETKVKKLKSPALLHQDMQLATGIIRDLFTNDIQQVICDSKKLHKEIIAYLKKNSPSLVEKVQLYSGTKPIFDTFGIEKELTTTYKRKVPLPNGGSIVIDTTEAMHVIDVNSGRSLEKEQERNALKTNLEAVKEIARQIRLRDLAGMIIIDFIDMDKEVNRKKIFHEMKSELQKDRAKTVVYPLTQLSLLQITRQRINQNISEKTSDICPTCAGSGRVTSKTVLLIAIERWLKNFRSRSREFRLVLQLHPNMAEYMTEGTFNKISRLMIKYFVKIKIIQNPTISIDDFRFLSAKNEKDITKDFN